MMILTDQRRLLLFALLLTSTFAPTSTSAGDEYTSDERNVNGGNNRSSNPRSKTSIVVHRETRRPDGGIVTTTTDSTGASLISDGRANVRVSADGTKVHVHATGRMSTSGSGSDLTDAAQKMEYVSNIMSIISDTDSLRHLDPSVQRQAQEVIQRQINEALQSLEDSIGAKKRRSGREDGDSGEEDVNDLNNRLGDDDESCHDDAKDEDKRLVSVTATRIRTNVRRPCVDVYKASRCTVLRNKGDCTDPGQRNFMAMHCALTCDLCNPLMRNQHDEVSPGVPQLLDVPRYDEENEEKEGNEALSNVGNGYDESRMDNGKDSHTDSNTSSKYFSSTDSHGLFNSVSATATRSHMARRVTDLMRNMERYYRDGLEDASDRVLFERCKNRHELCAVWAIQGMCETKPRTMADSCGPVCHLCHYNHVDQSFFGTTPFLRSDLQGLFEAIEANRVVRGWNGIHVVTGSRKKKKKNGNGNGSVEWDGDDGADNVDGTSSKARSRQQRLQQPEHRFVPMQQYQPVLYKPRPPPLSETNTFTNRYGQLQESIIPEALREKEQELFKKNNPYPGYEDGPIVTQFDSFLTTAECEYLLDLIRAQGVGHSGSGGGAPSRDGGPDGFGPPTTDARLLPEKKLHILRTSSRTFLQPSTTDGRVGWSHGPSSSSVANPPLERILDRIELVTGVPRSHIEAPIQFDKFVQGQFHEGQPHSTHRTMAEETLRGSRPAGQPRPNDGNADGSGGDNQDEQQARRNPRILGLTIFLNDAATSGPHLDGNGDVVFPHLNNIRTSPKTGRALLYPTVLSLEPQPGATSSGDDGGDRERSSDGGSRGDDQRTGSSVRMMVLEGVQENDEIRVDDAGVWQEVPEEADPPRARGGIEGSAEDENASSSEDGTPGAVIGGLKEDVRTILAHTAVKTGVKYTVTFFLRHRPYYETS